MRKLFDRKEKKKIRKRKHDESSEESYASFLSEESNINIEEFIKRHEEENAEEALNEEIFSEGPVQMKKDKWVLVSFPTKTTVKHYVGKITSVNEGFPTVKFVRRVKMTSTFVWPLEDDESEIQTEDIVTFLPTPVSGRRGGFSFPVSFSGLNVF